MTGQEEKAMGMEPTEEMIAAYDDAAWENPVEFGGLDMANVRAGLAAVLAIVARGRCMERRGHVYHPLARARECRADGPEGAWCERAPGHGELHGYVSAEGLVRW